MTIKDNGERFWEKEFDRKFVLEKLTPIPSEPRRFHSVIMADDVNDFIKEVESQAESRLRERIRGEVGKMPISWVSGHGTREGYSDDVVSKRNVLSLPSLSEAGDNGEGA